MRWMWLFWAAGILVFPWIYLDFVALLKFYYFEFGRATAGTDSLCSWRLLQGVGRKWHVLVKRVPQIAGSNTLSHRWRVRGEKSLKMFYPAKSGVSKTAADMNWSGKWPRCLFCSHVYFACKIKGTPAVETENVFPNAASTPPKSHFSNGILWFYLLFSSHFSKRPQYNDCGCSTWSKHI